MWFFLLLADTGVWWPKAGLADPLDLADQLTPASWGEMIDHGTAIEIRYGYGLILWEMWTRFVPSQMGKDQLPFSLVQQQV